MRRAAGGETMRLIARLRPRLSSGCSNIFSASVFSQGGMFLWRRIEANCSRMCFSALSSSAGELKVVERIVESTSEKT